MINQFIFLIIYKKKKNSFPNTYIKYKIMLIIPIPVAST